MSQCITIFFLNVHSLNPRDKLNCLRFEVQQYRYSIILLNETFLSPDADPPSIEEYHALSLPLSSLRGGLLAYIHYSIPFLPRPSLNYTSPSTSNQHLCFTIQPHLSCPINVSLAYRQPDSSASEDRLLYDAISPSISSDPHILFGDLHAPHPSFSRMAASADLSRGNRLIQGLLQPNGLSICNTPHLPTRPNDHGVSYTLTYALLPNPQLSAKFVSSTTPPSHPITSA